MNGRVPLLLASCPARRLWVMVLLLAGMLGAGCGGKKADSGNAGNQPGTPGYIPPAQRQDFLVNGEIDLPGLTQALRDYCQWKMRVPKDIRELVQSRYLTNLPAPPPGRKYAINPTTLEVMLVEP